MKIPSCIGQKRSYSKQKKRLTLNQTLSYGVNKELIKLAQLLSWLL